MEYFYEGCSVNVMGSSTLQCVLQGARVLLGITYPPQYVVYTTHAMNMMIRFSLFVLALNLIPSSGFYDVPGIVIAPYAASQWGSFKEIDSDEFTVPRMNIVLHPSNHFVPYMWCIIVGSLYINDVFRCVLLSLKRWNSRDNHIDLTWYHTMLISIPMLFTYTALHLGSHDIVGLIFIFVLTGFSGMCSLAVEYLRACVNTSTIVGLSDDLVLMLSHLHDIALTIATQVALIPVVYNFIHEDEQLTSTQVVTTVLLCMVYLSLMIIRHMHQHLCDVFEVNWTSYTSMLWWGSVGRAHIITNTPPARVVCPHCDSLADTTSGKSNMIHTKSVQVDGETPEDIFNRLYGCHVYLEPLAVNVGVQSPCVQSHVAYSNDDVNQDRENIGLIIEWRRYYIINALINLLLLVHLLQMAGWSEDIF
jgi:hypothetical protein